MAARKWVGQRLKLSEDPLPLTGKSSLLADLLSRNVYHAAILRGSYDHTHVFKVDASQALRMPGVMGVIADADAVAMTHPFQVGVRAPVKYYCMAIDKGRFAGKPVTFFGKETKGKAPDHVVVGNGAAADPCPGAAQSLIGGGL